MCWSHQLLEALTDDFVLCGQNILTSFSNFVFLTGLDCETLVKEIFNVAIVVLVI